jgi:DnaA family protein
MIQLILPLTAEPHYSFSNLIPHDGINEAASALRTLYTEGAGPFPLVFIHGPAGAGKTHLLKAALDLCAAPSIYIGSEGDPPLFPLMSELASREAPLNESVAVDDVHLQSKADAGALFALINKVTRCGTPLLLASEIPPSQLFTDAPHLSSRLLSGLVFAVEPPDDHVRLLILDKIAADKNIRVSRDVYNYLVARKTRNIKELQQLLSILDAASMESKRRITIPFVKSLERAGKV